jgi:prefoldin subunit 5
MNQPELNEVIKQLRRTVEILESDASEQTKIRTLVHIGSISTHLGERLGHQKFEKDNKSVA